MMENTVITRDDEQQEYKKHYVELYIYYRVFIGPIKVSLYRLTFG